MTSADTRRHNRMGAAVFAVVGALVACPAAMAQRMYRVPVDEVPLLRGTFITALSGSGDVAVGWRLLTPHTGRAFRWTAEGGLQFIEETIAGAIKHEVVGVNYDGSVVVGTFSGKEAGSGAFRWGPDQGGGAFIAALSTPPGTASGHVTNVSSGGDFLFGSAWGAGVQEILVWSGDWSQGGTPTTIDVIEEPFYANTAGISSNGSVAVGSLRSGSTLEASALRWERDAKGNWSTVNLGPLGKRDAVFSSGVSDDGTVVVGTAQHAPTLSQATGFRWTAEDGIVGLGATHAGGVSDAYAVSGDGRTIVGFASWPTRGRAMIWTEETGIVDLHEHLAANGMVLVGWEFDYALDVSDDGQVIIGRGKYDEQPVNFIADLRKRKCEADFDLDGVLNSSDFYAFLRAFFENDPASDFDGDQRIDSTDFYMYLLAFFTGCS